MMGSRHVASLWLLCVTGLVLGGCPAWNPVEPATENVAQEWVTLMLDAQEYSPPRPTVVARQYWLVAAGMYEAWAAYDDTATGYLTGHRLKVNPADRSVAKQAETISHTTYALLTRYYGPLALQPEGSAGRAAFDAFTEKMQRHGYFDAAGNVVPSAAQELGERIAGIVVNFAGADGSNEANNYADTSGFPYLNPALVVLESGTHDVIYPDLWQPLILPQGTEQRFLTPHWGEVRSFALPPHSPLLPLLDPGLPPFLDTELTEFVDEFVEVIRFSGALDPIAGPGLDVVDVSPAVHGNNTLGANDGLGHSMNPITGQPYSEMLVPRGDWLRCIAEFWADGPHSETPPGHWGRFAVDISRGAGMVSERAANKPRPADLEYDVKLFFMLFAAMHDSAIATWDVKAFYNYTRPISGIRYLAEAGLLPIEEGLIERIEENDPLAGPQGEHVGEYKIFAWLGPDAGCGFMRALEWIPYQQADFVTPAFPGYTSGHSGFSRAAAEILTRHTGDPFFPGGLATYTVEALAFEAGPLAPVKLAWATYYDASDEAGVSRLSGGIHVRADDFSGRVMGAEVATRVYEKAQEYFAGRGVAVAKESGG